MFQNDLIHAMEAMGLVLEDYQIRQFCRFEELLLETNKVMNLTAITDPGEVAVKHMADSLSCYDERYFPRMPPCWISVRVPVFPVFPWLFSGRILR